MKMNDLVHDANNVLAVAYSALRRATRELSSLDGDKELGLQKLEQIRESLDRISALLKTARAEEEAK